MKRCWSSGVSGIRAGAYYREKYGLRFVGHDASAVVTKRRATETE
jgi:hypothetical protein